MIVGGWDRDGGFDRKGVRVDFRGGAIARVCDSGRPERVDIETVPPEIQAGMEQEGVISQVAAPIVVSGRLWGATSISIGPPDRFPLRLRAAPREVHRARRGCAVERGGA